MTWCVGQWRENSALRPREGLFEVTCRTLQSRLLLRPSSGLNDIIVGVLARAQRLYPLDIVAYTFLSNHFHLLVWVEDSNQLAQFMCYFNSNLAREVVRWTGWADKVLARRYDAILISNEEGAQVGRLEYLLSQGCKEGLVARPQDWPGVHSIDALLTGQPVEGIWFDRAKESRAQNRGEQTSSEQYATREVLCLAPLPCWKSLSPEQYREQIREMLRKIELDQARRESRSTTSGCGSDPRPRSLHSSETDQEIPRASVPRG